MDTNIPIRIPNDLMISFQCDTSYCKCMNLYAIEMNDIISCVNIVLMIVLSDYRTAYDEAIYISAILFYRDIF